MVAAAQTQTMLNSKESEEEHQQQRTEEKEALELWGAGAEHTLFLSPSQSCSHCLWFGILNQVEWFNFMLWHLKSSGAAQFHDWSS